MIEAPRIVRIAEQLTAVIPFAIPRADIAKVMGPGIGELMEVVKAQGIGPTGPWFSHHHQMDPHIFDFEIGVPVSAAVKPRGRVKESRLPGGRVARAMYTGGYEGLGAAWGAFEKWLVTNGHAPARNLWECYVTDDVTELNRPVLGGE
ncbi:GyrI-like domain-containing protein [Usitatibacter palustris]|uniref:AraC effector-binding domain-containing protein n=1 Tax=Usitatibacter palustris TaxID=2732487 RepID=A0A6M4HB16_9PROT|nr:GyrI-like domain-containing protein [Usitatibacter palustris]QJR16761.1 hypothetical protein DSM104440_03597 [Usitatibacter palustris]